jgi:N-acyl-D-amino-acid deacylase
MAETRVLFRGGTVIDGSGSTAEVADVRVSAGRIQDVGRLQRHVDESVYDLDGLDLAPGFIDTHTHADCLAFLDTAHEDLALANLRQGVTTQVCGNCGFSPFPVQESFKREMQDHLLPALGPGTRTFPSLSQWREAVDAAGLPANLAPLVGHGSLRAGVMGFDDRSAAAPELNRMEQALDSCLSEGAFGFSTGLIYSPGTFAPTSELIRLAKVAARHGVPYATHLRNETNRLEEAVAEAVEIGNQSGVGVHISHHKAAGRSNWGRTSQTLQRLDHARNDGLDVTIDVYPYTAGSTALQALLPAWVQQGGTNRMLDRLQHAAIRQRVRAELAQPSATWQNLVEAAGWDGIVIAAAPERPDTEGKSLEQMAAETRQDPADTVFDLLTASRGNVTIILHMMREADVRDVLRWPHAMIGSDGILQPGRPHPRLAGTFARVLGTYAREQQFWPLPEAVQKMTSLPARRFAIPGRGRIAPGAVADIVVFDPLRLADQSTYQEPLRPPAGIIHVMVEGVLAIENGAPTGRNAGRVLRRNTSEHGL